MIVSDCLRINSRNHPRKIAIRQDDRELSSRELYLRVNRLSNSFLSLGLRKGTIVGLLPPSGIEHLESIYALSKIGAIVLPIDDRWGREEIQRTFDHFDVRAVIFPLENLKEILNIAEKSDKLKGPLICTQPAGAFHVESYDELIAGSSDEDTDGDVDEFDPFLIGMSSGTTGIPKGAVITHRNMIFRFLTQIVEMGFSSSDTFLNVTPMHHGGGRSFCMCHLFVGGSIEVLGGRFDPGKTLQRIADRQITTCFMVPTMYHRILPVIGDDFSKRNVLRVMITSGAPLPLSTRREIVQKITPNFYDYYATVDGGGISFLKPSDILRKSDSVGQGAFNTEIKIVDDKKQEVSPGTTGEVMYRGPGTARSYYNNPEATHDCFVDDWFLPGDLAQVDEDGFLYIVGRIKDMIIRGGVNIYPSEIEIVLEEHPAIYEAAVIGIADKEFGEEIMAVIVLNPDTKIDKEALVTYCKERLAAYKRPKIIEFVSSLPKASSGKIIKKDIRKMFLRSD